MMMTHDDTPTPVVKVELYALLSLCGPIVVSSILLFALNIEDQLIVGHLLQKSDLAAVAIGTTFFNLFWYVLIGLMSGIDTFSSQAYGAKQMADVGLWSQRGLFVCLAACVPIILIALTSTESIVSNVFKQNATVSAKSAMFVRWLMPGLPFLVIADVIRRWLQVQGHLRPAVTTGICVNLFNIGFNFLLVSQFGLIGSPIATSLSRMLQVLLLVAIVKHRNLHLTHSNSIGCVTTWPAWDWKHVLQPQALASFMEVALPGAAMLLLEAGAFETSTLIVGSLNDLNVLDAHFVLLSLCGFSFVAFPLSVSIACSIRVGNLLGSSLPKHAQMAAYLSIALGTGFMAVNGIVFATCKDVLGAIFTSDPAIIHMVGQIALIAACFQVVDGIQGSNAGALRGCGRQKYVMMTNLLGFWIIGIPVGALLCFQGNLGVFGVWWGLTIGLTIAAVVSSAILYRVDWTHESVLALARVAGVKGTESTMGNDTSVGNVALLITDTAENNREQETQVVEMYESLPGVD